MIKDSKSKVIIAGGRDFEDYEKLVSECDYLLQYMSNIEIVSGVAIGTDTLALRYAKEKGYSVKEFPADWEWHGRSAGYVRNKEMAEYATHLIAFWDGHSKGTRHMIDLAREKGLKVRVIKYQNPEKKVVKFYKGL